MKLQDLFEKQKVIGGNVEVPEDTKTLSYENTIVLGNFDCSGTLIKTLHGAPSRVNGNFKCSSTDITSFEGAPSYIGGSFICHHADLSSLDNIHKHIKYIGYNLVLPRKIESHILGVMFIKSLKKISFLSALPEHKSIQNIINKHLAGDRNVHDAQEELIEAGLKEYAKL